MKKKARNGGMGIVSTLTVIFIILKLLDVINWSWLWVLSPVWISALITLITFVFIISLGKKIKEKR